ncbi:MAG: hypothetical protein AB8G23_17265 [Myxococcota bacterium]
MSLRAEPSGHANRNDHTSGLTLLEVLAATMIFALVMTVLVGTSSKAVHRSGTASKRLEANLVADAFLADLEIQINQRIAPTIEQAESNREDFTIQVARASLLGEATDGPNLGLTGFGNGEEDAGSGAREIAGLLAGDLPEVVKHLYQYDIDVSWIDSSGVQNVTRTTFAFDWQAAALEFSDLFNAGSEGEDPAAEGEEGDESEEAEDEALNELREGALP